MSQRRVQRGTTSAFSSKPPLRFLRAPHQFTVQIGILTWNTAKITVTQEQRGGGRWTGTKVVDLDLEGRIPAEAHAELYKALEDFVQTEWIERISRTF